jgi:hypothetical protein
MGDLVSLEGRLTVVRTAKQVARERNRAIKERRLVASRAHVSRQRAKRAQRTAPWANWQAIKAFYQEAARQTRITGIVHEVDHIIPLLGETVCGLHVETNLRVVTKAENRTKSNSFDSEEWWAVHGSNM